MAGNAQREREPELFSKASHGCEVLENRVLPENSRADLSRICVLGFLNVFRLRFSDLYYDGVILETKRSSSRG
jgi:hypothetical protein